MGCSLCVGGWVVRWMAHMCSLAHRRCQALRGRAAACQQPARAFGGGGAARRLGGASLRREEELRGGAAAGHQARRGARSRALVLGARSGASGARSVGRQRPDAGVRPSTQAGGSVRRVLRAHATAPGHRPSALRGMPAAADAAAATPGAPWGGLRQACRGGLRGRREVGRCACARTCAPAVWARLRGADAPLGGGHDNTTGGDTRLGPVLPLRGGAAARGARMRGAARGCQPCWPAVACGRNRCQRRGEDTRMQTHHQAREEHAPGRGIMGGGLCAAVLISAFVDRRVVGGSLMMNRRGCLPPHWVPRRCPGGAW